MRRYLKAVAVISVCALVLAVLCCCAGPESSATGLVVLEREITATPTLAATAAPVASAEPAAAATATPTPGLGCLTGHAVMVANGAGIPGTTYYLAPALGGEDPHPPVMYAGPDREQGHVPGVSGSRGEIDLRDVAPGRYYLALWAPYDWVLAVRSSASEEPLLITIEPDTCTELGEIWFSWP
jgi:hypothetical protein